MIIATNHPIWKKIYPNIRNDYLNKVGDITIDHWEGMLLHYNIKVIRDIDNRVGSIVLPDGEELTMLLLKWC